ncbi:hypothetical protein BY996DRAFT_6963232 [Phakopsora pachyrhizi]|nr:hypothetical protein BY996DRAFT_6963232 [Phakopsora pachyrhizi]
MKLIIRMLVRSSPSLSLSLSLTLQLCLLVISNLSCFSGEEPKCSGSVNNYTFFASNMCSMVDTLYTSFDRLVTSTFDSSQDFTTINIIFTLEESRSKAQLNAPLGYG